MKHGMILCMISLITLCACANQKESEHKSPNACDDGPTCAVGDPADMSAYEGFTETEHQFIKAPMSDFLIKLDAGADAVYYFGFSTCPWCIEALPIMNDVAKENNIPIYYIDKKAETSDAASIQAIEERLADILNPDEEGKPHLYVPLVVVMKDGEIVAHHTGTVDEHDAHERTMNDEEKQQLKQIYQEMFQKLSE